MSGPGIGRVGDTVGCWVGGGALIAATPVKLLANHRPVARLADIVACQGGGMVTSGATMVLCCGLPVARSGDATLHGTIAVGSVDVLVGGPAFELPKVIRIRGPRSFKNLVIRDLYLLSTAPSGRQLYAELDRLGHSVTIVPEMDPHNSFAHADNYQHARDGTGSSAVVTYNPSIAVLGEDAQRRRITMPPQVVLGHELIHALNFAMGDKKESFPLPKFVRKALDWKPPKTQTDINREEAQTIGTGSFHDRPISENALRRDFQLPRRDNHYGHEKLKSAHGVSNVLTQPSANLRPGDC